jgi:Sad1 / UNC-like C-terminal.
MAEKQPNSSQKFSNLKADQEECSLDLETIPDTKQPKSFCFIFCWFFSLFFLGFVSSQVFVFVENQPISKFYQEPRSSYENIYSNKKTLIDYASLTNGGRIIKEKSFPSKNLNKIEELISENNSPGHCWAFQGESGKAVIKLYSPIYPQSFTMVHINSLNYTTAPQRFNVYRLSENEKTILGSYNFDMTIKSEFRNPVQVFECKYGCNIQTDTIVLEILKNYGSFYTCVYQFKVHGVPL